MRPWSKLSSPQQMPPPKLNHTANPSNDLPNPGSQVHPHVGQAEAWPGLTRKESNWVVAIGTVQSLLQAWYKKNDEGEIGLASCQVIVCEINCCTTVGVIINERSHPALKSYSSLFVADREWNWPFAYRLDNNIHSSDGSLDQNNPRCQWDGLRARHFVHATFSEK